MAFTTRLLTKLAIIQSFPEPIFDLAVYLCSLPVVGTSVRSCLGTLIAIIADFLPDLLIVTGSTDVWSLFASSSVVLVNFAKCERERCGLSLQSRV